MNITHTSLITVPVSGQNRAKSFYAGMLGFDVIPGRQAGPARWLQGAPGGALTSITLASGQPGPAPGTARAMILETADLDGDCAELARAGAEAEGPADQPRGRDATVVDPGGSLLVLASPTLAPPAGR
jgi:predicted enzyme related to lactoylglutathione lyase